MILSAVKERQMFESRHNTSKLLKQKVESMLLKAWQQMLVSRVSEDEIKKRMPRITKRVNTGKSHRQSCIHLIFCFANQIDKLNTYRYPNHFNASKINRYDQIP